MKRVTWICLGALLSAGWGQAQEPEVVAPLKTTASVGFTLTDGNSETLQANGTLVTEGEKQDLGSIRAGIEANYGESMANDQRDTTINNVRVFANGKRTLSPRTFGYVDGSVLQDDIADIKYRATLGPGLGAYLVKNDTTVLSVEAGPSHVWEDVADVRDDYMAVRFAERLDHALNVTAKFWQSAEFLPQAEDFGDFLLSVEAGTEAAMTTRMSLRVVMQEKYDSTPGDALDKNDLTLIAGLSVKL